MTDPAMPRDLDRLLAAATTPDMPAGLIDRIVAEAQRPGRMPLPPSVARRSSGRRWTRRGMKSGIVAVGLMLATAVAAAFGGGALSVAKIRTVAQHIVEHIRRPFHHAAPSVAAHPVSHRLHVPPDAIRVAPYGAPMTAPRPFAVAPAVVARPLPMRPFVGRGPAMVAPTRIKPARIAPVRIAPVRVAAPRSLAHPASHALAHRSADRPIGLHPARMHEPHNRSRAAAADTVAPQRMDPIAPRTEPVAPATASAPVAAREGGLRADGGARFDGPRWRNPDRIGGAGLRGPGWRRRMQGNGTGVGAPGWRAGGGAFDGPRPGRMRPLRPAGGRRPRRF